MPDLNVCPIDGTPRLEVFRYCRTCNFDFETAPDLRLPPIAAPPATPSTSDGEATWPAQPAAGPAQPAAGPAQPAEAPAAPKPASRPPASRPARSRGAAAPEAAPLPDPPAPPRELTAAERWQALTAQADVAQGWTPSAPDPQWPADGGHPRVPIIRDPELGWDATDDREPEVRGVSDRASTFGERPTTGGGPAIPSAANATATARAAATTGAAMAVATAQVVGTTVAREVKRYDRTITARWPRRRWLIHGATAVAALVLVAIPLSAAPNPAPATSLVPTTAPTAVIPTGLRIGEPANGSVLDADRVTFRGTGPAGAAVVQDIPLADDPRSTIGADGTWSLEVMLGPGENLVTLRLGDDRATQVVWTVTSTRPAVIVTPAPTPIPRPIVPPDGTPAAFAKLVLKGTGDADVPFTIPENAVAIAGITHKGTETFRVTALGADGQPTQVLVDDRAAYRGTSLFDVDVHSTAFRIEADGAWTITLRPVGSARAWDGAEPIEDDVSAVVRLARLAGPASAATVRHAGAGRFVLIGHREDGREVLVETTGSYGGAIVIPEGTVLFEVIAQEEWSITLG